jgi:hypothetical protein
MIVAPHPDAHPRSPSPPAARRNTSATPVPGSQSPATGADATLPCIVAVENTRRRRFR